MSTTTKTVKQADEGRLAQVLVAPIISEKATRIAEKQKSFGLAGAAEGVKPPSR